MALDGVEVMKHLGYNQFRMVGHDRGGRVGRRMAIDHPDNVTKLAVMDIVPAHYLYSHVTIEFVQAYFHWFNYLRPAPGPENELLKQNTAPPARPTTDEAQLEYRRLNSDPAMLHAMCEDYRASASIDLKIDEADLKAGKRIQCPLRVLWAADGRDGQALRRARHLERRRRGQWREGHRQGSAGESFAAGERAEGNARGATAVPAGLAQRTARHSGGRCAR